jgi:hypothetical protein
MKKRSGEGIQKPLSAVFIRLRRNRGFSADACALTV